MRQDLINASTELLQKQKEEDIWKDEPFESFNYLSADYSGKAGEVAFFNFLKRTKENSVHNWGIIYDGDSNSNAPDGTYDIGIIVEGSKKRLGIKTARKGKQKSFQHDHLHEEQCDCEVLLDITPSCAYLSVINFKYYSLKEKHSIFGITPHLRKNTSNNYKLDLRENHLEKGIIGNITIKLDETTSDEEIVSFLRVFLD
jgi:hypothetical protein